MTDALKARDAKDVEDAVRWALAEGKTLELAGRGSKRTLGRPSQSDITLDLSGLSGVTLYEPEELVLSARAGTPLTEIEALVEQRGQQLAFEPMDYGPILGGPANAGSLGGALAANLSGPRRIKAGAARDHFLGFSAVSGRAETFKSGGRVVKNVTGYDLCKLLAGSFGTLAAMTEVTIKTLPRPETEATVLILGLDDARANQAMSAAMASSCDVSAAAHLPRNVATHFDGHYGSAAATAFRLEGFAPSVRHRKEALTALLRPHGTLESIDEARSRTFWRSVRDAAPFGAAGSAGDGPLWRVSTTPARGAEFAAKMPPGAQWFYDWAGGLIWVALPPSHSAGAATIRRAAASTGGHATLVRATAATRAAVDVFEPQRGALAGVTKRVKESFDPKGVLNPGRMWAGV
ncbi:MAG: glycolate oxidase binding subunit [Alphaproteobacteria bacterium]|nr:glycolate oxidase binding subunit [Alphaproteobacteria bacterium]